MNFYDKAIEVVQNQLTQLQEMPEELSGWAAVTDEFLSEMIVSALTNYVLRADEPMRRVEEMLMTMQKLFLDPESMQELVRGDIREPRFNPDLRDMEQEVKRDRAMFLQWTELNEMDTAEEEE